jgi:hypothetical protein
VNTSFRLNDFLVCPAPETFEQMEEAMRLCEQTQGQSVYQHGESVRAHMGLLIDRLKNGTPLSNEWKIPGWFETYSKDIAAYIKDEEKIDLYTLYHDCGKPYCRTFDEDRKQYRFSNHEIVSKCIWEHVGGRKDVIPLIGSDMVIHTATAERIDLAVDKEWSCEDSVILLLASLAEIHSNSRMFGGIESDSFKIKWKTVERRGKQICKKLFFKI